MHLILTSTALGRTGMSSFGVLSYIGLVALVGLLAYFSTKLVGKTYKLRMSAGRFVVLDRLQLAPDKFVLIIKLKDNNRCYVLCFNKNDTILLDSFDGIEPVDEVESEEGKMRDFRAIFKALSGKKGE